jgi:IPT/TIG domain-containing protein
MHANYRKATLNAALLTAIALLALTGVSSAQTASTVSLSASQQTTTLPDGNTVPMWGWTCGDSLATAVASSNATCTALTYSTTTGTTTTVGAAPQKQLGGTVWQPPLIVIPYNSAGNNLTINLTNMLPVETSLMIIGQAGGGLGGMGGFSMTGTTQTTGPIREAGPRTDGDHQTQTATTWTTVVPGTFVPPTQEARARSFVPEVPGVAVVGATPAVGTYTWIGLKPGTYLIRTATYPSIQGPMGLYGVLVVTQAPVAATAAGVAYPAPAAVGTTTTPLPVTYDADVVALESEIDARQNSMVAALFPTACTATGVPFAACTGTVFPAPLPAGAPTANTGFSETAKWNGDCSAGPNGLTSTGKPPTCYPPAVDYTPLYFLINGVAFNKDNRQASALPIPATAITGNVLIRYVNAGSHMHIPSVNGLSELLVTEDAYLLPDVALRLGSGNTLTAVPPASSGTPSGLHLRNEVWQAAGKVVDVIVSPTLATAGTYATGTYLVYDRSLSGLSTDNERDGGMQAFLDVADSGATALIATNSTASVGSSTKSYTYAPGVTLTVSDPGKGILAGTTNVYGVELIAGGTHTGALTLNPNGTFTYLNAGTSGDTFSFYANGVTTLSGTVTFTVSSTVCTTPGGTNCPVANPDSYTSTSAGLLRVGAPGVLGNDVDPNGYPLGAAFGGTCTAPAGATPLAALTTGTATTPTSPGAGVNLAADGSFTANLNTTATAGGTFYFCYQARNSQGSLSRPATVTLTFPAGSGLNVVVQDVNTGAPITDYKWIIEQDLTMQVNPACQQLGTGGTKPSTCPTGVPLTVATNFHTSYMPVIAEGCTGPQSCEKGQTVYDAGTPCTSAGVPAGCSPTAGQHVAAACDGYGICTVGASQLPASLPSQALLNAKNPDGSPSNYYISILSGDAQNPFAYGNVSDPTVAGNCTAAAGQLEPSGIKEPSTCGHTMGGGPITLTCTGSGPTAVCTLPTQVTVNLQPQPLKTATVTAWVFEDDYPLNGEPDSGGGVDVLPTIEPGLGDFQIEIWDTAGGIGDNTGQMTYDMFNMPLTNALNGTIDPSTGLDACPITPTATSNGGVSGMIITALGSGYTSAPTVALSGGGGTGATATATVSGGGITGITITNAGSGYTSTPTVTFSGGGGSGAAAMATISGTKVAAGTIIVCPQYEADGQTLSPLVGQVVVRNLMQGKFSIIAHAGAAREARGEEWLQTNSLDGTHFLDSFIKVGEPAYFQEYGPGGYHVFFAEANPKIINARLAAICNGTNTDTTIPFGPPCRNTINGQVTNLHQPRSPSENLYGSGVFAQGDARNYAALSYTNCFASIGDTDGATIAFAKCDPNGNFTFSGLPDGNYGVVIFDQWDDFILDGSSRPANVSGGQTLNLEFPTFTWQTHLWTRTYMDTQGKGAPNLLADGSLDPATSPGLIQVPTRIRQVNGKPLNTLGSDITGRANFDETFPAFAWYSVESDTTRFRGTGVHVVNDAGGQLDGPTSGQGNGNTGPYQAILNSQESFSLPPALRVPGAVYCGPTDAACAATNFVTNPTGNTATAGAGCSTPSGAPAGTTNCTGLSTGRIDPGAITVESWQGGVSEYDMLDWGKMPYMAPPATGGPGENGGIRGHVVNATTRPFDDPRMLFQNLWEPLVPNVTINLYAEGTAPDGTTSLTLVDSTQTTSFDSWVQGFRADGVTPNLNCPGQDPVNDPFFGYTLQNTTSYLYPTAMPNASQFKCFEGYHNLNQLQPAPYDGLFTFPSQACLTGTTFTVATDPAQTLHNCNTMANPAFGATVNGVPQTGAAPKILPPGKYVTEVILPPGWQLNKEEDLNLLIGDQYIAPVTQQFVGLANIFIVPDQASIDSWNPSYTGPYTASNPYNQPWSCPTPGGACTLTPNTTNNGKPSTDLGRTTFGDFGPGGLITQSAPCVGLMRIVPDYLSIAPESGEIAPFAGALRALCDRKEITLDNQMQADVDFFIYTHTPKTTNMIGFVTDDFSSEFDPASPSYGEKFAVANVPVSIRDFNGVEVSRVYTDQFGTFNGLVYSTWEVDPPNITGYSPNMMITCMNDPGPIAGPGGTLITDPYYNPAYSIFCYENPFMPGDTAYLDVPVVPVSAFADGYNPPDCAYPDGTPAVSTVIGDTSNGGVGPWVSAAGHSLTINALAPAAGAGVPVLNNAYSGPAASSAPYNLKTIARHYSFGTTQGTVTIGGQAATVSSWSDAQIVVTVPTIPAGQSSCPIQQRNVPAGTTASRCGELVITTANTAAAGQPSNAQQSIDTVTVTIGGKPPTYVTPTAINGAATYQGQTVSSYNAIQLALDNATPGDLVMVGPGIYNEMLLMWKPVRLQGVGAASVQVNANQSPAGKVLEGWRRQVNCLFGLALNGGSLTPTTVTGDTGTTVVPGVPYDPTGQYTCPASMQGMVQPLPFEATVGWQADLNGNLAELLQEPTLMGAYEGAGITVLGQGVRVPAGAENEEGSYPTGSVLLTNGDDPNGMGSGNIVSPLATDCTNYPGNYLCNPSRVDGMSFTNSSLGGGGIWVHGWNHYIEVANNRIYNNGGTLSGGITIGQPEVPDVGTPGTPEDVPAVTGSAFVVTNPDGTQVETAYLFNQYVNVHNNSITLNASYGDELGSNTPAAAGGTTFCPGSDYYKYNYNFICGNLSSGNGGGLSHFGFSYNGDIEHNSFVFNQSVNPTLTTYGGGAVIEGSFPDGTFSNAGVPTECGSTTDIDCVPGLSDGSGPGLRINANLFQGNTAEEGSGGGLELQHVNGTDVERNPSNSEPWNDVTVTNNIFVNNVAGWDGGGVSLHDSVRVDFRNNTVISNDSTASAGILFDTTGAAQASLPPPGCDPNANPTCAGAQITTSNFEPAGLATQAHTALFLAAFTNPAVNCPDGNGTQGTSATNPSQCAKFSVPNLHSNLFWQNRAFRITTPTVAGVTPNSGGPVQLVPVLTQSVTGGAPTSGTPVYWDIGVYGDTCTTGSGSTLGGVCGSNHSSGLALSPMYSILDDPGDYASGHNFSGVNSGTVVSQYFNGSRVPPEVAPLLCAGPSGQANAPGCIQPGTVGLGITVPGGVPDSVPPPLPVFTLTPAATVDEGSNWINMFYGPLSLSNPTVQSGAAGYGAPLQNSAPAAGSPAIGAVPNSVAHPSTDFYGNARPDPGDPAHFDIGAIEVAGAASSAAATLTSISPNAGARGTTVTVALTGTNLTGTGRVTVSGSGVTSVLGAVTATTVTATFTISATAAETVRNVSVTTPAGVSNGVAFTVTGPALNSINPNSGARGASVPVTVIGVDLHGATAVNAPGSSNITVTNFVAVNDTTVTATLHLASATAIGAHNINVTTPDGTAGPITFTVTGATAGFAGPTPALITTPANTSTKTGTITVSNTAAGADAGALTLSAAPTITRVGGAGTGTFSISSGGTCASGTVLNPGQSCTVNVQYAPGTSTATASAHITVTGTGLGGATGSQNSPNFSAN